MTKMDYIRKRIADLTKFKEELRQRELLIEQERLKIKKMYDDILHDMPQSIVGNFKITAQVDNGVAISTYTSNGWTVAARISIKEFVGMICQLVEAGVIDLTEVKP